MRRGAARRCCLCPPKHVCHESEPGAKANDKGANWWLDRIVPARVVVPEPTGISDTVRDTVKPPDGVIVNLPDASTTRPAASQPAVVAATTQASPNQPSGVAVGEFQWVGFVVARVQAEPIYADKVLSSLDRALAAEAQTGNEAHFRSVAQGLITKQIKEFVENELEYAAAKKALEKKDEQMAKMATTQWRKEQVTNIRRIRGPDPTAFCRRWT